MKSLFLPLITLAALSVPCWGQDTATDFIKSDLIHIVFPAENVAVPAGESFVVQTPPNLEYTITPAPVFSLKSTQDGTGNKLLMVMKAQPPGYTITIDHVVIHPTAEERKKARDEIAAGILSTMTADQIKAYVTTQIDAKFADSASKDEVYQDSHFVKVGKGPGPTPDPEPGPDPTPDPTPSPAPIPEPGFRVFIFYEKDDPLPPLQMAIIAGEEVANYLDVVCIEEPDGTSGYRIYDDDADLSNELPVWQKAFQRRPQSLPWCIISNGVSGYEGPLPKSPSEFVELCKKYTVKP